MNRTAAILAACSIALAMSVGCNKKAEDSKTDPKKDPAPAPTPTPQVVPPGEDDQTRMLRTGPGDINMDTVMRMIPSADQIITLRMAPLVKTGLAAKVLSLMPLEQKDLYQKFVSESGIDPVAKFEGGVMWANSKEEKPWGKPGTGSTVILLGNGALADLVAYLQKKDSEDKEEEEEEEEDEDGDEFSMLILDNALGKAGVAKVVDLLESDKDLSEVEVQRFSDQAALLTGLDDEGRAKYIWVWSGGLLLGSPDKLEKPRLKTAATLAYAMAKRLKAAAERKEPTRQETAGAQFYKEGERMTMAATVQGKSIAVSLDLPKSIMGKAPDNTDEKVKAIFTALTFMPPVKVREFLTEKDVPASFHALAGEALAATKIDVASGMVKITTTFATKTLLDIELPPAGKDSKQD